MNKTIDKFIADYVDSHLEEAIALLEKIVNIESPTENLSGVREVGSVLKNEFESLGFTADWIDMPPEMRRAGHLIAEKIRSKGKRILLLGHLDTVLSGEKFRREDDKAYGTGILDMKAGNVILFYALKSLQAAGAIETANIIAMFSGDEENSGKPAEISRRDLIAAAKRSDLVLCFENSESGVATIARRGFSEWQIEVSAKTGHSSTILKKKTGSGAIFEAARVVNQFYELSVGEEFLTINPSVIAGGTEVEVKEEGFLASGKLNVVPANVIVRGDLRFISEQQKVTARSKMREIASKSLPGASTRITFSDGIPAMPPTDGNYALLKELDKVSQSLGFGEIKPQAPDERGASDILYIAHLISGLDGLGAVGQQAHARAEYIELKSLPIQIKRAAGLIYRLTHFENSIGICD